MSRALTKITRARSLLIVTQPFFGCLALHLEPVERRDIEAMATDGRALFFNPDFVESLSEPELVGVIAHEVMHCALGHHARLQNRDLPDFNRAADYAINPMVLAAGLQLPKGVLIDAAYAGLGAEEIYSILRGQDSKPEPDQGQGAPDQGGQDQGQGAQSAPGQDQGGQPSTGQGQDGQEAAGQGNGQPGQGKPGQAAGNAPGQDQGTGHGGQPSGQDGQAADNGQGGKEPASGQGQAGPAEPGQGAATRGQGGQPGAYGMGGIMAPAGGPAAATEEADKWQVLARQAANVAKAHNAGTVPGYLRDMLAQLNEPAADFRELLANWIDSRVAFDYSFSRPNRRFVHAGFYMPGATVDGLEHVVFAVDTSGSMSREQLNAAASEIVGALESGKIERLTVLMADKRVCSVAEFTRGDDCELEPAGGGGTDFRDTFRWIEENAADATAVVYLTDLDVKQFGQEPACPVLWAVHGDSRTFKALAEHVPFGEPVYIGRL